MNKEPTDLVFSIMDGCYQLYIAGEVLPYMYNSKGAALAGLEVEKRRRAKKMQRDINCKESPSC